MFGLAKQTAYRTRPSISIASSIVTSVTEQFYHLLSSQSTTSSTSRTYITRAHPKPTPEFAITDALEFILKDVEQRKIKRTSRIKMLGKLKKKSIEQPISHPDETVELAINLNLDPRKPGQALRGSITLPHGTGKKINCVVFTKDEDIQQLAIEKGATYAGGEELIESILSGEVAVDSFQTALATKEIVPTLSKKIASLLGPRGLMPNAKVGTLLPDASEAKEPLIQLLDNVLAGKEISYRTEKQGIVHVPVGKASFGINKLLSNIGQVMQTIFDVKPDNYGKGRKGKAKSTVGKGTKYLLQVNVSSTQGKGWRLDLRTVDPSSPFFLSSTTTTTTTKTEPTNEQKKDA